MREEHARVVAVRAGKATVELAPEERCGACGLCSAFGGRMRIDLDAVDGLERGQTVIVAVPDSPSLRSILLLFGLPLAALVGGAALGQYRPFPGLGPDASSVVLALGLLLAAFLVAVAVDRKTGARGNARPAILRIESDERGDAASV